MRIFIVAGEASGDQLGASLVRAVRSRFSGCEVRGVGGSAMQEAGVASLFPLSDIAVMGLGPVIRRLPTILRRMHETVSAIHTFKPDVLVTIDSPDFSKRVARKVRSKCPSIATLHWVCPSVWAWRPGRAPAMRPYIDHILCLLPFEPAALERLSGPNGTYVGHPLLEKTALLRPQQADEAGARAAQVDPLILVLPGSRQAEIRRLLPLFLATIRDFPVPGAQFQLPTLEHIEPLVRQIVEASGVAVTITTGDAAKYAGMRRARAALAASGTVTLELALAGIPMITAYKMAGWEAAIARQLVSAPSAILANLILGNNFIPEFLQEAATASAMGPALARLCDDSPERDRQIRGMDRLEAAMALPDGASPSALAADILASMVRKMHQ
ncbi:LpxB Lipid A disaccharide synthetase [Rhabdaerophilaceae bacterium]